MAMFAVTLPAVATNAIIITDSKGASATLLLADNPVANCNDDEVIFSITGSSIKFLVDNTVNIKFVDVDEDGVENIETTYEWPVVSYSTPFIQIKNVKVGDSISVYGIDGLSKSHIVAAKGESVEIDSSWWSNGIYIVSINNLSFKVLKP